MKHVSDLTGQKLPSSAARLPYITVHAFCDTEEVRLDFNNVSADRRMARTCTEVAAGGLQAAAARYETSPSPDLVIVETTARSDALIKQLEGLAAVCEAHTKVLIVGYENDIAIYRSLMQRGVSDYLVGPICPVQLISRVAELFEESKARIGRTVAVIGCKGGVGSSTIAQNLAFALGELAQRKVVLADLDLAFGTVALDLDLDARQGILEAVRDSARLDEVLLERLLVNYSANLAVLPAPATLEATYDLGPSAFEPFLDVAQGSVPFTVLDVPHLWTDWVRQVLTAADEVVVTAVPDLANLRNAKQLYDALKKVRPNDPPKLVLNQVGMPKRKEIKPQEFGAALGTAPLACLAFEPAIFSDAAINGRVIAAASKSRASKAFREVAGALLGRPPEINTSLRLASFLKRSPAKGT